MCPLCQKLTCEECIEKWLSEKKSQCPHCRVNLNFNQLIHLSFMTDVANYIDKLSSSKKAEESEICEKHQIQNLYYCIECETPLCSDCYMLEEKHKMHKIKKIDEVFKAHLNIIKQEKEGLDFEENTLKKYLKDIGDKIIEIGNTKYKKIKESEEFFKNIRNQIQTQSQEVITNLLEKKQKLETKLSEIQNYSKNFNFRLKNSSKNEIISESNNLIKELKEIKLKILTENSDNIDKITNNNLTLNIQNPLVPKYETGIYKINNYEKIKSDKVIYSPEMHIGGLIWKLKIYPRGNVTSKGECISVFLELQSGVIEPSKYFYVLELVNFKNRRNYYMEYSSNFSNGECWGYSNFYKIKKLKEDGFIDQNGDIMIKVHIRPESFEQLARDLKGYIQVIKYQKNKHKLNESIIGEEDEEEDEDDDDNYTFNDNNLTRNQSLKYLKFANEFFADLNIELFDKKRKIKNRNKINFNKNHSFDEIDLNKNGGKHENNKTDKKINKNNKNKEKKISNDDNIMNIDIKKKEKVIYVKNNSQVALSLNETENNNNINRQNILISGLKNNNNYNNNSLKFNNNSLNNINNIKTEPESKFKNINSKIPSNIIKDTKLLNMAKIDISSDSEEEQKKANEDPFLIPKKKNEQFIMEDDSFDFLVDSMKLTDENKNKKDNMDIFDEFKYNLEKKKGKEKDYGRGRNNNVYNYDKNYIPFRNYYNYYGNGQNNNSNTNYNDNSSSIKFPNDFDTYKKKYYK
jgi:tripartite motif-containing protein 37